jgi:hypothetical protein
MDIQTQIGQVVQLTGITLMVVALAWDQKWFLGTTGNRLPWHSTQAEAEYMEASLVSCEAIWIHKVIWLGVGAYCDSL